MGISRVQQKLGVVALPYTSMFTLSNTAVTCWVCFPSPVLMSSITVKQKLGVVALPYTSIFTLSNNFLGLLPFPSTYEQYYSTAEAWGCCSPLYFDVHVVAVAIDWFVGVGVGFTTSHTAVTCWVCSPSPVLKSNSRVQQKLGVVALPYTSTFTLSNTAVTCWVCFPSPVLMSSITVKQKLGVLLSPIL